MNSIVRPFPNELEYLRMKSHQDEERIAELDKYIVELNAYIDEVEEKNRRLHLLCRQVTDRLKRSDLHPPPIVPSYRLLPEPVFVFKEE
jgi:uncharacterized coiled-coil protein SlyX